MAYSPIEESYMNGFVTTQFATPEPEPVLLAENKNISYPGEQFTDTGGGAAVGTRLKMPSGLNTPENIQKVGGEILPAGGAMLKGAGQASAGMYGDIEGLGRMVLNYMGVDVNKETKLPTTEDVKTFLDKYIPVDEKYATFEKAGELASPAGAYGLGKAGIKAIKSTKGMPVGMSIKDVSPKLGAVKPGDELIVQHNLTADKLVSADKLGGMPVPSLAISKAATPLENFGDITLIGGPEMAVPSAKNPVFKTDAYTKTRPGITYTIDDKSAKNLDGLFSDIKDKVPNYNSERYSLVDNIEDMSRNRLMQAKFLSEKGMLPDLKEFERSSQFEGEVRSLVDQNRAEYENWVNEFKDGLPDAGVVIKEKLFKGHTNAGNRIYREANIQNIVSHMKGGAGSENVNYGVGNLRAVATPKFKTFNQIKASRSKVVSDQDMTAVKDQADNAYRDLLNRLSEINPKYDASDAILEIAETRSMSGLNRAYGDKVPQELKADIGVFIEKLKDLPTAYFEIKPQRAVDISEFRGAIIPKDTPQKARDVLKKNGITEVYEYSTPEERKSLFQKYGKEMFTVAPAMPAASQQEENK